MNSRRQFLARIGALTGSLHLNMRRFETRRPNILWIIAEDFGPQLGCYGTTAVQTPHLDRLAEEGMRCTRAFTASPVCSASRSSFCTGMYQTSIGAHNHRSHRDDGYRLPAPVKVVTEYFRNAGYFTANVRNPAPGVSGSRKTDWNFTCDDAFDSDDWQALKEHQPFYSQVNLPHVHRMSRSSSGRVTKLTVDPDKVEIPPYYPDHPITRRDMAEYLSDTELLDQSVSKILARLEQDGLSENTIVFFFGDHGQNHVRGKQWLYDDGIHIPLIIRWPGKIKGGTVNGDLINAIDFAPTSLKWAGIDPPSHMEGQVFWGEDAAERKFIVAARDRCDETVDRIRCIRTKRYKYIRNYYPERPYTQYNRYKWAYYPVLRLMHRLHGKGELTPVQERWMAQTRPAEELYDLVSDSNEIHNLASDPAYENILSGMRQELESWIAKTGDKGAIPEPPEIVEQWKREMQTWELERVERLCKEERMSRETCLGYADL
jgi:N-sulfoglucosamine sulfohydrolase